MLSNILVYGWYSHGNAGDELFKDAFHNLFPELKFTFTDKITSDNLKNAEAVFIGGGSFLNFPLVIENGLLSKLKEKPLFYLGVGSETEIHPVHQDLIKVSKLINIRNSINLKSIKQINDNVICSPDLVYSLLNQVEKSEKINKSILILPNLAVTPQNKDPYWKHSSWNYFKSEFSQFLDFLLEKNYKIDFLPFCFNNETNDQLAAAEIVNHMNNRKINAILPPAYGIKDLSRIMSQYDLIVTQRYHGVVVSEMINVPYISIYHHDKLKPTPENVGLFVSYYGLSKNILIDNFNYIINDKFTSTLSIERNIFEDLRKKVLQILSSE
jgi:polysaccharide pyruvyl transferase WcaK-like protein